MKAVGGWSVVKVHNGKIEAVGAGSANIKCTTMNTDGYVYTTILKITVRSSAEKEEKQKVTDIQFTYFDVLYLLHSSKYIVLTSFSSPIINDALVNRLVKLLTFLVINPKSLVS